MLQPADFAGLRMRIQASRVLDAQMRSLGAQPLALAFSDPASPAWREAAAAWLRAAGFDPFSLATIRAAIGGTPKGETDRSLQPSPIPG